MTSWHHHVDWPQLWLTSCVPLWVEVELKCVFRHTEDYFHYQLIYDKERKVSWLRFFGGDQIFSQLCLCERNSNVRLFSQSVWVKQTRRRTSSWFCHENKCWASLTVCTECNLISSCICIQSLSSHTRCDAQLVTGSVWSVWWVVEQDLIHLLILWQVTVCLQLRHGSHSALLQQVCWWLPEGVRTWEVRSEPTARTHTHTCGVLTVCVVFVCSTELKCKMKFAVYLPPKAETDKCPVLYWLSGECGHDAAAHNFYLLHQHHVWSQEDNSHWGPTCPHDLYKEINTTSRGRDEGRVLWAEDRDCSQR